MRTCLRFVAGAAIDKFEVFRVPSALAASQVRVAVDAGYAGVNGRCAGVFGHEDGYFFAPAVAREVRFGVAPEASRVVLRCRGARRQQKNRGKCEEPALPVTTVEEPRKG